MANKKEQIFNRIIETGLAVASAALQLAIRPPLFEPFYYRTLLGIRKEYTGLDPLAATLLVVGASLHTKKHHSITEGYPLPEVGQPAIITGNHFLESDSLQTIQGGRITAGRLTSRCIVRMSLVKEGAHESAEYLESIGKDPNNLEKYNPVTAFALRGAGVFPIMRDKPGRSLIKWGDKVLADKQMLCAFMMPSRNEECLLRCLEPGAAFFAIRHPDVPVYVLVFSGPISKLDKDTPDKLTILKPYTYAEKRRELGKELSVAELTILNADMAIEHMPERSRKDWETRREVELERLRYRRSDLASVK